MWPVYLGHTYVSGYANAEAACARFTNASEFLQVLSGSIILGARAVLLQRHRRTSSLPL